MIDLEGFRANVGIVITNMDGDVLLAKRTGQEAWQFPQGGLQSGEIPRDAMYRELQEEVGLSHRDVSFIAESVRWYTYRLPKQFIRHHSRPLCIGQKQKWFLLRLNSPDSAISFEKSENPEFSAWQWVDYWEPINRVIFFKKAVYESVLNEFSALLVS